jgi:hypothetical protein
MNLHDLPPRDQERYLDGVTVGRGTCEAGRPMAEGSCYGGTDVAARGPKPPQPQ